MNLTIHVFLFLFFMIILFYSVDNVTVLFLYFSQQVRRHTSSSSEESMKGQHISAKEYVESLHQNSKNTLLYGKNNVLVQPVSSYKWNFTNIFTYKAISEMLLCMFFFLFQLVCYAQKTESINKLLENDNNKDFIEKNGWDSHQNNLIGNGKLNCWFIILSQIGFKLCTFTFHLQMFFKRIIVDI